MNAREFLTAALLSSHRVLMEATLPAYLPDEDEQLDAQITPLAEKVAKIAALYATELTLRWETCMEVSEELDEDPDLPPST